MRAAPPEFEIEPPATTRHPSPALLYSLIGVMILLWSLNFVVGKVALRQFPALLLGGLRCALAGALMLPIYAWSLQRQPGSRPRGPEIGMLLMLGFFGVALNQLFFVLGLSRTSVAHAAILVGLTPIIVLLIAASMRMERITGLKVLGMGLALAGIGVLNAAPKKGPGVTWLGDLAILASGVTFAIFTVSGKRVSQYHGTITVSTFAYAGGALVLAPMTLWYAAGFDFGRVTPGGWASLVYMAAFPSVVSYLIYYWALTHVTASRVAAFSYLQPLLATLLGVALLDEKVTGWLIAGGALVLAGVFVTERLAAKR